MSLESLSDDELDALWRFNLNGLADQKLGSIATIDIAAWARLRKRMTVHVERIDRIVAEAKARHEAPRPA